MTEIEALRNLQLNAGAKLSPQEARTIPLSFGNDSAALKAARSGVALYDRTHWGRIWVSGGDRIRFLHNQSTNNFNSLQPGQGCDTVFVNSTGRTVDLVTAYVLEEAVLLLTSPDYAQPLIDWMDRFIFFADKVDLKNITDATATFSVIGPESDALLSKLDLQDIIGEPHAAHRSLKLGDAEVRVAVGSGLSLPGYTFIVDIAKAAEVWSSLTAAAVPLGETAWEQLRVQEGRPTPGHELTEDFNPLEAGLWQTISLSKGCYIGQETIARLHTYRGVKQQLWGVKLSAIAEPGSVVMAGDEKVGKLTSCTQTEQGVVGLAYIRTKAAAAGLAIHIGDVEGELTPLPFVSHEYP